MERVRRWLGRWISSQETRAHIGDCQDLFDARQRFDRVVERDGEGSADARAWAEVVDHYGRRVDRAHS